MSMPSLPLNTPFSLLSICDQSFSQLPTFIPPLDISLLSANLCLFSLLTQPHIHPLTPASFTPSLTRPCVYPLTAFYLSICLLTHPIALLPNHPPTLAPALDNFVIDLPAVLDCHRM